MADDDLRRAIKRAQNKVWKDANRDKVRAAGRAYSKAHREQANAWKAANRDKVNAASRAAYDPTKARAYYLARRREFSDYARARYLADPEAVKDRVKAWRLANPDKARLSKQAWCAANKPLVMQRVAEWNAANPEAVRARSRNYRARLNSAEGSHTADDVLALFARQRGRCVYCPRALGKHYHVDHIKPLSRGGSNWPSNLQLTCAKCNNHKRATDPLEFARRLGRLV